LVVDEPPGHPLTLRRGLEPHPGPQPSAQHLGEPPATRDWAFHPTTAQVAEKIRATLPFWKRPLWWWSHYLAAWPFSVEWLSAAFDVNVAPFYQSFVEVRVEPSAGRVRMRPYGVDGRLRWSALQASPGLIPAGTSPDDLVEWTVPIPGAGPAPAAGGRGARPGAN
jgi:hypothetical protein